MWDFETDPEYQADLDWTFDFVRDEVEPLQYVIPHVLDLDDRVRQALIPPLQQQVKDRGLWATHLGPDLGGKGHGQVKLALLNEILGRVPMAPIVFGCQAPDCGNAEILAHYGTEDHKRKYLQPLLNGDIIVGLFNLTTSTQAVSVGAAAAGLRPLTRAVPKTAFMLVDLPEALPPSRQTIWPARILYETPRRARNLP